MKPIIFLTVALTAMIFVSCDKVPEDIGPTGKHASVAIKFSGVAIGSRAIEAPGETVDGTPDETAEGTIKLSNGHIFVISATGDVFHSEPLDMEDEDGNGENIQILNTDVPSDSRIYFIGNIPEDSDVASETTMDNIEIAVADIASQVGYETIALANAGGTPVNIVVRPDAEFDDDPDTVEADATITVNPLISRLELGQVTGNEKVLSFTVAGVYVDDWYPEFTFGGSYAGEMFEQEQSTDFSGNDMKDESGEGWVSSTAAEEDPAVATPGEGVVWAYNVPSGNMPRLLIAITDMTYLYDTDDDPDTPDEELTSEETLYLTVRSYSNVQTFERGKIYRIGGDADGEGILFGPGDTGLTPNFEDITLEVDVLIDEWTVEYPEAILQ